MSFVFSEVAAGVLSELGATRSELLAFLTHVLLGDALAAEYLLLHLISNVYVELRQLAKWHTLYTFRIMVKTS